MYKILKWASLGFLILVITSFFLFFYSRKSNETILINQVNVGNYSVELKNNPTKNDLTDISLRETNTGKESFYGTMPNIYREHYHAAEFVAGNLYIVKRIGVDVNSNFAPDWTDELWKYGQKDEGKKIFVGRGLDFRVSQNGQNIAVVLGSGADPFKQNLYITNSSGTVLNKFGEGDFKDKGAENILSLKFWSGDILWGSTNQAMIVSGLYAINVKGGIDFYDVSPLNFVNSEFALSPINKKIVFDTFVPPLAVDNDGKISNQAVSLYLYDLVTKEKKKLATLTTNQSLKPSWLSDEMVEYIDSNGNRVEVKTN